MSEIENVKEYFVRSAGAFDSLYSEEKTSSLMRFINKKFRKDIYERFILSMNHVQKYNSETILDVGCGSGRYAYALAQIGIRRIVGVDLSSKMIDLALRNTSKIERADGIFKFMCCEFMKFNTDETFDTVIAMGLFDYISDPITVLEKMRMLANHSVIASFPSISFYRTPVRKVRYHFKRCPVYFYNREQINLFCSEAGFQKNEIIKIAGAGMDYFVTFFK